MATGNNNRLSPFNWLKNNADTIFLLVVCFLVTALLRGQVTMLHKEWQREVWQEENILYQPTRMSQLSVVNILAAGIKPLVADIYWTKAMAQNSDQVFEMQKERAAGNQLSGILAQAAVSRSTADSRELYDLIRIVTRLDPDFEYAYYYGATLLTWDEQVPLGLSLLEAGLRTNPKSAMMASSLSFVHYYFLNDWTTGAEYAQMSFENAGKYAASPKSVANLYAAGRNYEMAIEFLTNALEKVTDQDTRAEIENQIAMLMVEYHVEQLEKAVDIFKQATGIYPPKIEGLVKSNVIKKVPEEPFGGKFVILENGRVTNEPEIRNDHYKKMRRYKKNISPAGRKHL